MKRDKVVEKNKYNVLKRKEIVALKKQKRIKREKKKKCQFFSGN